MSREHALPSPHLPALPFYHAVFDRLLAPFNAIGQYVLLLVRAFRSAGEFDAWAPAAFERVGFGNARQQQVGRCGVMLTNFVMEKTLRPRAA